jgi:hypothetical protein
MKFAEFWLLLDSDARFVAFSTPHHYIYGDKKGVGAEIGTIF